MKLALLLLLSLFATIASSQEASSDGIKVAIDTPPLQRLNLEMSTRSSMLQETRGLPASPLPAIPRANLNTARGRVTIAPWIKVGVMGSEQTRKAFGFMISIPLNNGW